MKIAAGNIDAFINRFDTSLHSVLLYGPDNGLISLRAQKIIEQIVTDPSNHFAISDISTDQLKEDPAMLWDQMNSINLTASRQIIRIKHPDNSSSKAISDYLTDEEITSHSEPNFLLVIAGELTPSATLRKLFESGKKHIASLPCYVDDERGLEQVIAKQFQFHKCAVDRDAITYLAQHSLGDRMIVLNEIEKLLLYVGDKKNISLEDAIASIGQTTETTLDDICFAAANGDQGQLEKHLRKALQQGAMPITIIRALLRYFLRLQYVNTQLQKGQSVDAIIKTLRPSIFFKHLPAFKRHVSIWKEKPGHILRAIETLYRAELECKQTGSKPDLYVSRCTMRIAAMV